MSLPSDPERGRNSNCWCRATSQTQYLTVRSKVGWFMGHWAPKFGGSCRCIGELCSICASGSEPRPFYYIAVSADDLEIKFLEIPRRHREVADELDKSESGGVGYKIMIQKDGVHKNSPILLKIIGFEVCEEFDIWAFVGTLGKTVPSISAESSDLQRQASSQSVPSASDVARTM